MTPAFARFFRVAEEQAVAWVVAVLVFLQRDFRIFYIPNNHPCPLKVFKIPGSFPKLKSLMAVSSLALLVLLKYGFRASKS